LVKILVSAGEASGDLYAANLVEALRRRHPDAEFFGCGGPRMRAAGVRILFERLSVVGLVEVVRHIPAVYGEFRRLVKAAEQERPDLAILCDTPDFHLRVAKKLKALGIPVVYLIAPQVWAWRQGRVRKFPALMDLLLCIFPFEQPWFRRHSVNAVYIGHPLTRLVRAPGKIQLAENTIAILPGSRQGEVERHLPILLETVDRLRARHPALHFVLALPEGFSMKAPQQFSERIRAASIQVTEGFTWDVLAQAKVALAASGTVTMEAAMLGTPMVTFYRVNALSWFLGRRLVRVPHVTMVNLIGSYRGSVNRDGSDSVLPEESDFGPDRIVSEWIQDEMTPANLAGAVEQLLEADARDRMRSALGAVVKQLSGEIDPMEKAASEVDELLAKQRGSGNKRVFEKDSEHVSS